MAMSQLQMLRVTKGAMQLLDLADHLPGLPRLPGLKKWYARDKLQYYEAWKEADQVSTGWFTDIVHCNGAILSLEDFA